MNPELLAEIVPQIQVFSRVSPRHKLRIVQALQKSGQVVAMTGDGINDCPALKAADVGVAMAGARARSRAKVADVILETDDLHAMLVAIEQGRVIHADIKKAVRFILATNLSEILLTRVSVAVGFGESMSPLQLLWINLVGGGIALTLLIQLIPRAPQAIRLPAAARRGLAHCEPGRRGAADRERSDEGRALRTWPSATERSATLAPGLVFRHLIVGGCRGPLVQHSSRSSELTMQAEFVFSSESVTRGHPDKVCDQISDKILAGYLKHDPEARVVAEAAMSTGIVFTSVRFWSRSGMDISALAREAIAEAGYVEGRFKAAPAPSRAA